MLGQELRQFKDNLGRLLGLHSLSQTALAELLPTSAATVSTWLSGRSFPNLNRALLLSELFEISTERLINAQFTDLLANELTDPERFERVETRIRERREHGVQRTLALVPEEAPRPPQRLEPTTSPFRNNFTRLLGLHRVSQHALADAIGTSAATISAWTNAKAQPSLKTAMMLSDLFEISTERLMNDRFVDLLTNELADPERFERVETRIQGRLF